MNKRNIGLIILGIALLCGFLFILANAFIFRSKKVELECKKFGAKVFKGPDGSCYRCPAGYRQVYTSDPEKEKEKLPEERTPENKLIKTGLMGIPICRKISESSMTETGKIVLPAISVGGGYSSAQEITATTSQAQIVGSYVAPVQEIQQNTKDQICKDKYQLTGLMGNASNWTGYDPADNVCRVCPDGYTKNPDINDWNSSQICQKSGVFSTSTAQIETHPVDSSTFTCPEGYSKETKDPITNIEYSNYYCYKCPDGYTRDPTQPLTGERACRKQCPTGTFQDITSGKCVSCPEGYRRTGQPISSLEACKRPCPEGTFSTIVDSDPSGSGKCYKCPVGYRRMPNEAPNSGQACFKTCPEGSFRVEGGCYKCPDGYTRNPNALTTKDLCIKPCAKDNYAYEANQTCYSCPAGYNRVENLAPFDEKACLKVDNKPADLMALQNNEGNLIGKDEINKTVNTIQTAINKPVELDLIKKTINTPIEKGTEITITKTESVQIDPTLNMEMENELGTEFLTKLKELA